MAITERDLIKLFRRGTTAELNEAIAELTHNVGQARSEQIYARALRAYDRETEEQNMTDQPTVADVRRALMAEAADFHKRRQPHRHAMKLDGYGDVALDAYEGLATAGCYAQLLSAILADLGGHGLENMAERYAAFVHDVMENGDDGLEDANSDIPWEALPSADAPEKTTTEVWVWEYAARAGGALCDVATATDLGELKKQIAESFPDHTWEEVERRGIRGTSILVGHGNGRYADTGHWVYRRPANEEDAETLARVQARMTADNGNRTPLADVRAEFGMTEANTEATD